VSRRSRQKSQRISEVSQLFGMPAVYGGKKLWIRRVYSLKWKTWRNDGWWLR